MDFRTHAHGQGYADLNFIIPERIGGMEYRKGPYFADLGDLSSAGEANYHPVDRLEQGIASINLGKNDYYRAFVGDSFDLAAGTLTLGMEYSHKDGPWETGDNFRRINGAAKYHQGTARGGFAPRPLEESGKIESKSSSTLNARAGYRKRNWEVSLDILNLLDRDNNDIEYYYESRLRDETAPVADVHLRPAEARTLRASVTCRW